MESDADLIVDEWEGFAPEPEQNVFIILPGDSDSRRRNKQNDLAGVAMPKTVVFIQIDCAEKFVEIELKNAVIAIAMVSIFNEDIRKFYSKIVDKPNRLWYI